MREGLIISAIGRDRPGIVDRLSGAIFRNGCNLEDSRMAILGGEFALALDGPLFPTPSLKLVVEVYDPARFQKTLEGLVAAYAKAREPVAREYEDRIAATLREFDARYEKEKSVKLAISLNIGRLSAASVFTNTALAFCRTGIADRENFIRSLDVHGQQLFQTVFRKHFEDMFFDEDGKGRSTYSGDSGEEKTVYPAFSTRFLRYDETLARTAPDLLLLVLYNLIFFAAAYYSFTRYDVR